MQNNNLNTLNARFRVLSLTFTLETNPGYHLSVVAWLCIHVVEPAAQCSDPNTNHPEIENITFVLKLFENLQH